jgi:hypothetical protein
LIPTPNHYNTGTAAALIIIRGVPAFHPIEGLVTGQGEGDPVLSYTATWAVFADWRRRPSQRVSTRFPCYGLWSRESWTAFEPFEPFEAGEPHRHPKPGTNEKAPFSQVLQSSVGAWEH